MTVNYTIDESDYLTYMLYVASVSDTIKRRRQRSKVIIPHCKENLHNTVSLQV